MKTSQVGTPQTTYLTIEDVQPIISYFSDALVDLFQGATFEECIKDRGLKYFDELKFAASFHFESKRKYVDICRDG